MQATIKQIPGATYPVSFSDDEATQAILRINATYDISQSIQSYIGYSGNYGDQTLNSVTGGFRIQF